MRVRRGQCGSSYCGWNRHRCSLVTLRKHGSRCAGGSSRTVLRRPKSTRPGRGSPIGDGRDRSGCRRWTGSDRGREAIGTSRQPWPLAASRRPWGMRAAQRAAIVPGEDHGCHHHPQARVADRRGRHPRGLDEDRAAATSPTGTSSPYGSGARRCGSSSTRSRGSSTLDRSAGGAGLGECPNVPRRARWRFLVCSSKSSRGPREGL